MGILIEASQEPSSFKAFTDCRTSFSVPIGVVSLALLVFFFPQRLPNEPSARSVATHWSGVSLRLLQKVDIVGALMLLGACLLITTALELAAEGTSFASTVVLYSLVFSGVGWVGFVAWEWVITTRRSVPEPVLPWRFFQSRAMLGMILYVITTLLGRGAHAHRY